MSLILGEFSYAYAVITKSTTWKMRNNFINFNDPRNCSFKAFFLVKYPDSRTNSGMWKAYIPLTETLVIKSYFSGKSISRNPLNSGTCANMTHIVKNIFTASNLWFLVFMLFGFMLPILHSHVQFSQVPRPQGNEVERLLSLPMMPQQWLHRL